jgi:heme exporter protein C
MLLMTLAFWLYAVALALWRVRSLILERESHAARVQQLPEVRARLALKGGA